MTVLSSPAAGTAAWLASYARARKESATASPASQWTAPLREAAMARFAELGFPTSSDEDWRKTSVAAIARTEFALPAGALTPAETARAGAAMEGPGSAPGDAFRLVLVDGRLSPDLSRTAGLPTGVVLCGLDEALARHRQMVEPHLARIVPFAQRPFAALNTAFMGGGSLLWIPDGVELPAPLHLIHVTQRTGAPAMFHPRHIILAGRGSRARVVESYMAHQAVTTGHLVNAVTEILLEEGASLDHLKLQRESLSAYHVATTRVRQQRSSRYTSHVFSLGAALSRNDLDVELAGAGAECTLNGLYKVEGRQHVDHHTTIDHTTPDCLSREIYKGVLSGQSRGVFNGKVMVRPDAHGTDSVQTNRNLLLSEEALVDTKPELQIFNNDVKCRHAATTGQIDETALFYLRSRALGLDEARDLLIRAFIGDLVGRVEAGPLRDAVESIVSAPVGRA